MFTLELNVSHVEFAVTRAIQEMNDKGERISCNAIAAYINCHPNTVKKSLSLLIASGQVIRTGTPYPIGYQYEVVNDFE
jgi:Mn-dependent DtxR family transcriptional regulator